jgi:hypothetical protein
MEVYLIETLIESERDLDSRFPMFKEKNWEVFRVKKDRDEINLINTFLETKRKWDITEEVSKITESNPLSIPCKQRLVSKIPIKDLKRTKKLFLFKFSDWYLIFRDMKPDTPGSKGEGIRPKNSKGEELEYFDISHYI